MEQLQSNNSELAIPDDVIDMIRVTHVNTVCIGETSSGDMKIWNDKFSLTVARSDVVRQFWHTGYMNFSHNAISHFNSVSCIWRGSLRSSPGVNWVVCPPTVLVLSNLGIVRLTLEMRYNESTKVWGNLAFKI